MRWWLILGYLLLFSPVLVSGQSATPELDVVTAVAPVYPPLAVQGHVSAEVVVRVRIDRSGKVASAEMLNGHVLFESSSVAAAKRWVFARAHQESEMDLTFTYRLLPHDARATDAGASFFPPRRVEVRERVPPPSVNYGSRH